MHEEDDGAGRGQEERVQARGQEIESSQDLGIGDHLQTLIGHYCHLLNSFGCVLTVF